jgi:hypothetical protein
MGLSRRTISVTAFGTSDGSARTASHWSGLVANSHIPDAMVLMVVSNAATTYPASSPIAASTGIWPALCAWSTLSPKPPGFSFSSATTPAT